jgi:hypothetical protein
MGQGVRFRWVMLLVLLPAAGCGSRADPGSTSAGPSEAMINDHNASISALANPSNIPAGSAVPTPADPVSAVKLTLVAMEQGRLEQAYDFLPDSYQQDVDSLVQNFARKMDPELWDGVVRVLRKAAEVLSEKQKLALPIVEQFAPGGRGNDPESHRQLVQNWDSLVEALEELVDSELGDLNRLKRASSRQFLANTGRKVFALIQTLDAAGSDQLSELSAVQVTLMRNDPEHPIVAIQGPHDSEPVEHEFVKVEDHWIPQSLAAEWPKAIHRLQDQLDRMTPGQFAAQKPQALRHLQAIEAALDEMLEAQKPEEFIGAIVRLQEPVYGLYQALNFKSAPPGSVIITVDRELKDAEQTKLLDELTQLSDQPERAEFTATRSGGRTRVSINHVNDVAAFAERMTFPAKKTVDAATRSIHLEMKSE